MPPALGSRLLLPGLAQAQPAPANASNTFDAVRARGQLVCGVNTGLAGFAQPDSQGVWRGFDADYCRAIAAAIFGDPTKVRFVPTTAQVRFTALQSGEVDVLARNTTWTLSRDTALGLDFAATNFFDGQGFMVKASLGVKSAKELDGATICVQPGTTTEQNLDRLGARQPGPLHAGGDRAAGGAGLRLYRRPLRRLSPPTSPASPPPARPSRSRTTT